MDDEEQELEELERLSGEAGDTRELPGEQTDLELVTVNIK